jgi:CBS domain-containing protein
MRTLTVRDVMTPRVVIAREETPFKELVRIMAENRVSGVPIVAGDPPRLAGIVTEADLLRVGTHEQAPRSASLELFIDRGRLEAIERPAEDVRARDIWTRDVVTVGPGVSVRAAARRMLHHGVKRLPVVDEDGQILGIVSRRDVLRPYLRSDEDIRREVEEDLILKMMWIEPGTVTATVSRGVVHLERTVDLNSSRDILEELVRRVAGVVGVENELGYRSDDRKIATGPLPEPRWGLVENQVR